MGSSWESVITSQKHLALLLARPSGFARDGITGAPTIKVLTSAFLLLLCPSEAARPALLTSPGLNKSLIFYTITSRSLPAHGWVRVSPVCLPLCANFRPIICCNKCAMGRVTFTLIVCTQRGSLPPHHGSKVPSIVSDFLFPFLATVCCFFSLSLKPGPRRHLRSSESSCWTLLRTAGMRRCLLTP